MLKLRNFELYCEGWSVESPQQEAFIARKINFFSWCYKKQTNPMETALLKTPITRAEEEAGGARPRDADTRHLRGQNTREHDAVLCKDQQQSERKRAEFIIISRVKYRGWRDIQHVHTGSTSPLCPRDKSHGITAQIPELQSHSNQSFN